MSELLLFEVAKLLLRKWKPSFTGGRASLLPSPIQLAGGLERLLQRDPPFFSEISSLKDAKDVDLDKIISEIKEFQKDTGKLVFDGVLGNKTLSELMRAVVCVKSQPKPTTELSEDFKQYLKDEKQVTNTENWYLYYIEDLPQVPGANNADFLVMNAWSHWMEYADVKVERLPERLKSAANVVIKTANLSGTVLGQANVGNPPGKYVLEIEMDSTRQWNAELFEGAVTHEIGHVLGLEHQATSGLLMSAVVPPDWRQRMDPDGKRAAALKWLGPAVKIPDVQPISGGLASGLAGSL